MTPFARAADQELLAYQLLDDVCPSHAVEQAGLRQYYVEQLVNYKKRHDRITLEEQAVLQKIINDLRDVYQQVIGKDSTDNVMLPKTISIIPTANLSSMATSPTPGKKRHQSVMTTLRTRLFSSTPKSSFISSNTVKRSPSLSAPHAQLFPPVPEKKTPVSANTTVHLTDASLEKGYELLDTACPPNVKERADLRRDFLKQLAKHKQTDPTKPRTIKQQQAIQRIIQTLQDMQPQPSVSQSASASYTSMTSSLGTT